jgi:hypothetical protein
MGQRALIWACELRIGGCLSRSHSCNASLGRLVAPVNSSQHDACMCALTPACHLCRARQSLSRHMRPNSYLTHSCTYHLHSLEHSILDSPTCVPVRSTQLVYKSITHIF